MLTLPDLVLHYVLLTLFCFYLELIQTAVADIFRRQTQARIMVGDPHQQIYSFRGAVNAMDMISATCTFYLTQVWILQLQALT